MSNLAEFNQIPICCGLDVHKKSVTACLIITDDNGEMRTVHRKWSTLTSDLEKLGEWLLDEGCSKVAIESTGPYWKPLFNILEEAGIEVILANARYIKNLPGRKTDMSDAEWLGILLRNGLIRGSFIPPRPIRELRDLSRLRTKMIEDRTRIKNRINKLLEDANIKISSVISDLFGVSGLSMLRLLASKKKITPKDIASLARGKMKKKYKELCEAAYGRMSIHHKNMLRCMLEQYDSINSSIEEIEQLISIKVEPYTEQIKLLSSIPGVERSAAIAIIAETGVNMSVFPTEQNLASWAGVCPGNNESAGIKYSSRILKGNNYLKSILCQTAWAATRERDSYLSKKYWALKSRRGAKKAIMAIAHKILKAAFHILRDMELYRELGPDYLDEIKKNRNVSIMIQKLEKYGYTIMPSEDGVSKTAS